MPTMKTLVSFTTALHYREYRVTGNAETVNLQERPSAGTWRTMKTIPRSDFDAFAEQVALYHPCTNDPALIRDLIYRP